MCTSSAGRLSMGKSMVLGCDDRTDLRTALGHRRPVAVDRRFLLAISLVEEHMV